MSATASVIRLWSDGGIFEEIAEERAKQDEKWGEQNHPPILISGTDAKADREDHVKDAEMFKTINDSRTSHSWDTILLEEVHEAFAEEDPAKIREELVQVGAVVVAAIESLDRNELNPHWRKS
jgi:hypothetical protein